MHKNFQNPNYTAVVFLLKYHCAQCKNSPVGLFIASSGNLSPVADVSHVYISIQLFNLSSLHLIQLAAQQGAKDLWLPQIKTRGYMGSKEIYKEKIHNFIQTLVFLWFLNVI